MRTRISRAGPQDESLFSMSAFDGLLAIRRYSAAHPATGIEDVVSSLRRVSADDAYHDYDTAAILSGLVHHAPDHADVPFFRHTLGVLRYRQPIRGGFARCPTAGNACATALTGNEEQSFEAAGLFCRSAERAS